MKTSVVKRRNSIKVKVGASIRKMDQMMNFEMQMAAIQALIPLGLQAVEKTLQAEVKKLVGLRYSRGGDLKRWGENPGSVYLGDQKVRVSVPRVRNQLLKEEVPLQSYERLQSPQLIDQLALTRVIRGMSQRDYEEASIQIPETFGIKKTSVCRRFIRASAKKLKDFLERDLSQHDIVAIFIDGKTFAENSILIALGVTMEGEKIILGFVETSTENHVVCKQFINELKDRGLRTTNEIFFILDGGKGLHKGVKEALGEKAIIQRCQWHKRENILRYLSKEQQGIYRAKIQAAYEQPTYERAKSRLEAIRRELRLINESAVKSLDEGFEETLTLHRLGLYEKLGESFKTTNCVENINKLLARQTDRVDRWHNSNQRQRWVATAMLNIEPRLRRVNGHKFLIDLRIEMKNSMSTQKQENESKAS